MVQPTQADLQLIAAIKRKRSNIVTAQMLKMSKTEFLKRKKAIMKLIKSGELVIQANYIAELEDKITQNMVNLDTGKGTIEGLFSYEPQSAEEIIKMFKIDTGKWRLSSFWNKQQPSGKYLVSANITQLKGGEISNEDVTKVIKDVFLEKTITPYEFVSTFTCNEKSLMVYTSDKHVGAYLPDNALYQNKYDYETFARRMERLLEEIIHIKSIYGRFESIYIMDLGDSMDGFDAQTTRKGHALPQNMNNREAFEAYVKAHKDFFDNLVRAKLTNNIEFIAVTNDNHSADFGYITNRALEEYLNVKYPQVQTRMLNKFIEHFTKGEHTFVLTHGKDSEDMKHGMPLHMNPKTENFINHYLDHNKIDSQKTKVHFIKGDLHQNTSEEAARFRYRNTLSMFGSSKWAMHNFIPQSPGVSFDIIENNTDRVFEYKIQFNTSTT